VVTRPSRQVYSLTRFSFLSFCCRGGGGGGEGMQQGIGFAWSDEVEKGSSWSCSGTEVFGEGTQDSECEAESKDDSATEVELCDSASLRITQLVVLYRITLRLWILFLLFLLSGFFMLLCRKRKRFVES
jgi:hypothetical protein